MPYPSDLTDEQWDLLEPVFNAPGKRGRRHADDLRSVVDAMLYIAQTGCQWRYLPETFGPWTRVWSQFRRWSRNGTWAHPLTVLHAAAPRGRKGGGDAVDGRHRHPPCTRSIQQRVHVPRPRRPLRPYQGAKRVVAVDVTGLPLAAVVVPASTHGNRASELLLEHLTQQGVAGRLELVLVDRGVTAAAARDPVGSMTSRSVGSGWDDKQPVFRPIRHAWRVEVAHGRLHRHDMVHLSRERARRLPVDVAA